MTMDIQQLTDGGRAAMLAHFLALTARDRSLRFGTALAPAALASYVDRIDFRHGAVFGARDGGNILVGVAHVAFEDDFAEVGLSVLPDYRRRGFGAALFERAIAHARNSRISRLIMHFLWSNVPIMRIARRFRMRVVATAGDARAHLDLPSSELAG
jgi:GNAT superfamily N-acetyltransferase